MRTRPRLGGIPTLEVPLGVDQPIVAVIEAVIRIRVVVIAVVVDMRRPYTGTEL
jgi:hypothetical protein